MSVFLANDDTRRIMTTKEPGEREYYVYRGITLPTDLRDSLTRYVEIGCPTGGFLEAVIDNDLKEACSRADDRNLRIIPAIVAFLYNECPAGCWGRAGVFAEWVRRGGLKGRSGK